MKKSINFYVVKSITVLLKKRDYFCIGELCNKIREMEYEHYPSIWGTKLIKVANDNNIELVCVEGIEVPLDNGRFGRKVYCLKKDEDRIRLLKKEKEKIDNSKLIIYYEEKIEYCKKRLSELKGV